MNLDGVVLCIQGTLLIKNSGVSITNSTIFMGTNAKIEVDNSLFDMNHTSMFSCSGYLYEGINIINPASFSIEYCTIFDAKHAINVHGDCLAHIEHNHFNDDYIGVKLDNSSGVFIFDNVFNCYVSILPSFPDDGSGPNFQRSYAGIVAENQSMLLNRSNYFQGLHHGVRAENSIINSIYCTYRFILPSLLASFDFEPDDEGYCIFSKNCTLINCFENRLSIAYAGIYATNSSLIDVHNNYFYTISTGIYNLKAISSPIYRENNFDFSSYGIIETNPFRGSVPTILNNTFSRNSEQTTDQSIGIWLNIIPSSGSYIQDNTMHIDRGCTGILQNRCNGSVILDNDIFYSLQELQTGNVPGSGISLTNSNNSFLRNNQVNCTLNNFEVQRGINLGASRGNTLCCNSTTNSLIGFGYVGACGNTTMNMNTIAGVYETGLLINGGSFIGHQPIQPVSTSMATSDNIWDPIGNLNRVDARNFNSNLITIKLSQFSVQGCVLPFWPSIINPNQNCNNSLSNWFVSSSPNSGQSQPCETICQLGTFGLTDEGNDHVSESDYAALNNEFAGEINGEILSWETLKNLYLTLHKHPNLISTNYQLDSFYQDQSNGIFGQLYIIDSLLFESSITSQFTQSSSNTILESIRQTNLEIDSLWQILDTLNNPTDSLNIITALNSKVATINNSATSLYNFFIGFQTYLISLGTDIQDQLDDISPSTKLETNEKLVRQLFLDLCFSAPSEPSNSQLNQLFALSELCPYSEGYFVFFARAIYSLYNPSFNITNESGCSSTQNLINSTQEKINNSDILQIQPNPSNEKVTILLNEMYYNGSIKIISSDGKIMHEINQITTPNITVNTIQWPDGLYACNLYFQDEIVGSSKLIIQK